MKKRFYTLVFILLTFFYCKSQTFEYPHWIDKKVDFMGNKVTYKSGEAIVDMVKDWRVQILGADNMACYNNIVIDVKGTYSGSLGFGKTYLFEYSDRYSYGLGVTITYGSKTEKGENITIIFKFKNVASNEPESITVMITKNDGQEINFVLK